MPGGKDEKSMWAIAAEQGSRFGDKLVHNIIPWHAWQAMDAGDGVVAQQLILLQVRNFGDDLRLLLHDSQSQEHEIEHVRLLSKHHVNVHASLDTSRELLHANNDARGREIHIVGHDEGWMIASKARESMSRVSQS